MRPRHGPRETAGSDWSAARANGALADAAGRAERARFKVQDGFNLAQWSSVEPERSFTRIKVNGESRESVDWHDIAQNKLEFDLSTF